MTDSWSMVVLPDTQVYAEHFPELMEVQTQWIAEHQREMNVRLVLHEGDVVERPDRPSEWHAARAAFRRLDGVVPYVITPGNHDYVHEDQAGTRSSGINQYWLRDDVRNMPTSRGSFQPDSLDNTYHVIRGGDADWMVLSLEYGPREEVIAWADGVLREHRSCLAILLTHAYLYSDGTRYDHVHRSDQRWNPRHDGFDRHGSVHDGEELWRQLVSLHANMRLVLCGHVLNEGVARLTSRGVHGNAVHQVLATFQMRPEGGEGYLRILRFFHGEGMIQVRTYSPYRDRFLDTPEHRFNLDVEALER